MTSTTKDKQLSAPPRHSLLYLAAVIASSSGPLLGCDTDIVCGALLFLKTQYYPSSTMQEVVTGAVPVGVVLGAAGSRRMTDRLGRRLFSLWSTGASPSGCL